MTKFVHIVQVHPIENDIPNRHKVKEEQEFEEFVDAMKWLYEFNFNEDRPADLLACYRGCVNDETGELV